MRLPELYEIQTEKDMITTFSGYNKNIVVSDNEFFDMRNMSSNNYPVLSTRNPRGAVRVSDGIFPSAITNPRGLLAKEYIAYVDGSNLVYNNEIVYSGLSSATDKQLVSIGAYIVIFPDGYYYNTKDSTDNGNLALYRTEDAWWSGYGSPRQFYINLCDADGNIYDFTFGGISVPTNPQNGDMWLSRVVDFHDGLLVYSSSSNSWLPVPDVYMKLTYQKATSYPNRFNLGTDLSEGDSIYMDLKISGGLTPNDGNPFVLEGVGEDYIIYKEPKYHNIMLATSVKDENGYKLNIVNSNFTIERRVPKMDYVTESGNRIWGCRYGENNTDGKFVNEIYASKLGDPKNWNSFAGISTDSYVMSLGSDGKFTGAANHNGYPVFFKEDRIMKIMGTYPSNYQLQEIITEGVQDGSSRSIATISGTLFYKSDKEIRAYDGGYSASVSAPLGNERYHSARAGVLGNKYYISMSDSKNNWHMFCFDSEKGLWHKEDDTEALFFCSYKSDLYYIDKDNNLKTVMASVGEKEGNFDWNVVSGIIGYARPNNLYISRLNIRAILPEGSKMSIYIKYDSIGDWEHKGTVKGRTLRSFNIPIIPRRCDHFRYKIEGDGEARILSISKTLEMGSDVV